MRLLCAFGAVLLSLPLAAQELVIPPVHCPALPDKGSTAEAFVPAGWRIESRTDADLNGDGRPDLVLVLRQQSPANIVHHDGFGENPLDTNPRILAVAWALAGGGYALALQNHTLIPRHEYPNVDDVLAETGGVTVQRGTLRVTLHYFANAGSWSTGSTTYAFRWQGGRFELIGYDSGMMQRNTGAIEAESINYLTGKVKRSKGNIKDDEEKVSWEKLPSTRRLSLDEIGDGSDFAPLPGRD